jgi:murein DD-endopeptidase MepM/ murein hydrolase activator NlpD
VRAAVVAGLAVLLLGPATCLVGLAVVMNPAAQASCLPTTSGGLGVGNVPARLDATTTDGTRIRLNHRQLTHAGTIIDIGGRTPGVGRDGVMVALMAALTESSLRMLSNTSAYPASGSYPNDGDGGDHDSLGLFQMRPSTGWGSLAQLMDPTYQARAFFGGPNGPNHGSPRGLLDIPGWQTMPKGAAAQAVEVSAYPDRYATWEPVAARILTTLTRPGHNTGDGTGVPGSAVPETGRVAFPLPAGAWVRTSGFGMRRHPVTGVYKLHTGVDYAAPAGTRIMAVADGRVVFAGPATRYGNLILITHTVAGSTATSGYAHMEAGGVHVSVNDTVTAGQHIGDVGSSGYSTGPHLHFEIRPGGAQAAPVDPEPWLASHGAGTLDDPGAGVGGAGGCAPDVLGPGGVPGGPPEPYEGPDPDRLVDDPTSEGRITARTAYVLAQVRARFPSSSWACWSPRPGTTSEHPLGRACDGTFGNSIGHPATGAALELGWTVTNWLKTNARTLGVEYLIWQGRIWSVARASEGWRPYDGGGMHDPADVTGGHYDHLHFTIAAN